MCQFVETIAIENNCIKNIEYHNFRLNQTREDFFNSKEKIDLRDFITLQQSDETVKCRVVYSKEIETVEYTTYVRRDVQLLQLINDNNIDYSYKKRDRSCLSTLFLQRGQADDIIIVKNNKLTDTSIANIALFNGSEWITPKEPLLKGTKRMELLDKGRICEGEISVANLNEFSHITFFNAMIDFKTVVLPISALKI